jgi:asparagine synthase (glutamine-hydrolysing)
MPFNSDRDLLGGIPHSRYNVAPAYLYMLAPFADQRSLRQERIFERLDFIRPIEERAFLARALDDTYGHLQLLLHRNDRLGMAASLESRFPFLDNDLLDLSLHLPFHAKRHQAQGKWAVKKFAARKLLPDLVYAKKIGFAMSNSMWMSAMPLLRDGFLAEALKWSRGSRQTIIERLAESAWLSYLVLSAELWGRMYFCHATPEELSEELLQLSSSSIAVKC